MGNFDEKSNGAVARTLSVVLMSKTTNFTATVFCISLYLYCISLNSYAHLLVVTSEHFSFLAQTMSGTLLV